MDVLGLSCYYHDAAACLLRDGVAVAAAEEERFSREKHDSSFPHLAIGYCLDEAGIAIDDLDYVAFYDKPIRKFDRILETYLSIAPRGFRSFLTAMPRWMKKRLWMRSHIKEELDYDGTVVFGDHHQSHAASSFYASPFDEAAFLTVDGVGEWTTTSWGTAGDGGIAIEQTIRFPHSLGLLYSAFTYYLGFEVNNGEYKVMGLSSYGEPRFADTIREELLDVKSDGSFRLDMQYFDFLEHLRMTNDRFADLFGQPRREPDSELDQFHFDVAASAQRVTEELLLDLVEHVHDRTGMDRLVMAGGVALNSVANGRILRESDFEDTFIQPAAGDDGGAYGVAACFHHEALDHDRDVPADRTEAMNGTYLGPSYGADAIDEAIVDGDVTRERFESTAALLDATASRLADGAVVGCYQGRMEWGPRALGNRSILADPRDPDMQDTVNMKIKFREGFRPFAPSVLADRADDYFAMPRESPYMLQVVDVHDDRRDELPAVTHVDGTARVQTVSREDNATYYDLIEAFGDETGTPVLLNTSLNRRGEPIVCTPEDGVACFEGTNMDHMVFPDADVLISD